MRGLLMQKPIKGRITLSGYEGSELLVGRLLIECGADVRYVGSACPPPNGTHTTSSGCKAKGVQVQMRASLEQDLNAMYEYRPQLAIGTTPVVQIAKQNSVPSLVLHQPDFGPSPDGCGRGWFAGAGGASGHGQPGPL
jgi:3,8-divinyl chlorophyllide a/chlorophyllide a reductase subunit Y